MPNSNPQSFLVGGVHIIIGLLCLPRTSFVCWGHLLFKNVFLEIGHYWVNVGREYIYYRHLTLLNVSFSSKDLLARSSILKEAFKTEYMIF